MLFVNLADSEGKRRPSPATIALKFKCHACGNCCRGDGYVFLEEADARRLAVYLGLSMEEFKEQYTTTDDAGSLVLIDQNDPDQSCIFLKDNICSVHEAKPQQCRNFPFKWRPHDIERFCEGWREACNLTPLGKKGKQERK